MRGRRGSIVFFAIVSAMIAAGLVIGFLNNTVGASLGSFVYAGREWHTLDDGPHGTPVPESEVTPAPHPLASRDATCPYPETPTETSGARPLTDTIAYASASAPITEPVTKFGGQPVWVGEPQWPVGPTGVPMQFIGQIALDTDVFPHARPGMAYLFAADGLSADGGDFYDWASGDNAVILQPDRTPAVPTIDRATGPTIAGEWRVVTEREQDVAWIPEADRTPATTPPLVDDKIGGTPFFIQSDEYPECGAVSTLLLQLAFPPFDINLMDGGSWYFFIDETASRGGMVAQSH